MNMTIDRHRLLKIEASSITLCGGFPIVNGQPLTDFQMEIVLNEPDRQILHYHASALGNGTFGLEIGRDDAQLSLRYWLEGLDAAQTLDSFGLQFKQVENLRAYLRNGYTSWDGSNYVDVDGLIDIGLDEIRPETGYAMTQLLPRYSGNPLLLGFDRHDRFQHIFKFDTVQCPPTLTILTLWDRKDRTGLARCESERLVMLESEQGEEGLRQWASVVAQSAPTPPRVKGEQIRGWCSWYNLYSNISEENILEYLAGVKNVTQREDLPLQVFLVDEGFTQEMGDWLEVKPKFPRGIKPLLDDIREAGFVPGLWIGPFMVGNRSNLYRQHPDWVVKDRQTNSPLVQWRHVGESRWAKLSEEYYILDATHPDAFEYLRQVFRTWRHEWGCEYFKTDFMHFGSDYGPDRVVWHTPGMTRIEIWRKVAEMIREEIGDAFWLGCGCPLWPGVGLQDAMRIGNDVGVEWKGRLSAQSLLSDLATRNYANQILWQIDPDCVLLRDKYHNLTDHEVHSLALYAGMSGGILMTSDDLQELTDERMRLWKFLLSMDSSPSTFPLLGRSPVHYDRIRLKTPNTPLPLDNPQSLNNPLNHEPRLLDPVIVQVRPKLNANSNLSAIFILNTGEFPVQRTFDPALLGLSGSFWVYDWWQHQASSEAANHLSVTLDSHEGALLLLSKEPFSEDFLVE
ncbi:MAG: alpha-galactosidase [Anaerolineae bacterium]|nr:alpha-galactosidase [Anaerolineae bacterium]